MPRTAVPTVGELEARIDEALVIARASEAGVREVGEMAIDAAREARRAAEAAEASARAAAVKASGPAGPVAAGDPPPLPVAKASSGAAPPTAPPPGSDAAEQPPVEAQEEAPSPRFDVRLRRFSERADRVSARLRALQDHPRHQGAASVGAGRHRGDG